MPYCIYLRKSRADIEAEARGEGETLARHEKILLELAKRQKLTITAVYREIVSGETIAARPVMQQLLSEVSQGMWTGVLVVEVERLARGDTTDQGIVAQTFKFSGTKIVTPNKIYDPNNEFDEEYFEFGLFMSRREYKTINRRLQQGRVTSVKEGKYVGNRPPYGYRRVKLEKQKGFTLEPVPEETEVVKMIFDLYTHPEQRLGVSLIVRRLNDLKIPPAKGDVWSPASVRDILMNPVYIGKIKWNSRPVRKKMVDGQIVRERPRAKKEDWILVDGLHPAIVESATFDLAQKYLAQNPSRPGPKQVETKNSLSSLIVCGFCGRKMVRRPYQNGRPDTLICANTACPNVSAPLYLVEERLINELKTWLKEYRLTWTDNKKRRKNNQVELKQKAIQKIDNELKNLEKQMERIHTLLEQGIYDTNTFLDRSKKINDQINETRSTRQTLLQELDYEIAREESQKVIIPTVERILELYKMTDEPELKNQLLKEVIMKAVYTKTVNGRWHHRPDDFELVIYPKLSGDLH